jgi:hypothetical protein
MDMTDAEKVHENRVRRQAERQGYVLKKSRRRDPFALEYGKYLLYDPHKKELLASDDPDRRAPEWLTLAEVDGYLAQQMSQHWVQAFIDDAVDRVQEEDESR